MERKFSPARFFSLFIQSLIEHKYAIAFIKKHQIWKGLNEYKWIMRTFIFVAVILSLKMISDDFTGVVSGIYQSLFVDSSSMYIILILLEVLIFHCSVRTLNILKGENKVPTFKDFVAAEKRMITVSLRCFIIEAIVIGILTNVLPLIHLGMITPILLYGVRFYFTGFIFLDNYNEQYGQTIKESVETVRSYIGVAVGVGAVAYLLFKLPVAGAVIAPILGSVVASTVMEKLKVHGDEERNLHSELVESISFSRNVIN